VGLGQNRTSRATAGASAAVFSQRLDCLRPWRAREFGRVDLRGDLAAFGNFGRRPEIFDAAIRAGTDKDLMNTGALGFGNSFGIISLGFLRTFIPSISLNFLTFSEST